MGPWARGRMSRREEIRRRDHLLAAALERIPQLEAPPTPAPRDAPQAAAGGAEGPEERPFTEEAQEGSGRPWWRRLLGLV